MKTHCYDLRVLIMKSDLENALLENYQMKQEILTNDERLAFIKYQNDSSDIFGYVRDILLQIENIDESMILFKMIHSDIRKMYPNDKILDNNILKLRNNFYSSIKHDSGDLTNLFFKKNEILNKNVKKC